MKAIRRSFVAALAFTLSVAPPIGFANIEDFDQRLGELKARHDAQQGFALDFDLRAKDFARYVADAKSVESRFEQLLQRLEKQEQVDLARRETCEKIGAMRKLLREMEDASAELVSDCRAVIGIIEQAGDAPESLGPLGRAMREVAQIDGGLKSLFDRQVSYNATMALIRDEARGRPSHDRATIPSDSDFHRELERLETLSRTLDRAHYEGRLSAERVFDDSAALYADRDRLLLDVRNAMAQVDRPVPGYVTIQERASSLWVRVASLGGSGRPYALSELQDLFDSQQLLSESYVGDYRRSIYQAIRRIAAITQARRRPFGLCDDDDHRFDNYVSDADAAIRELSSSVSALEFVFLSRLGKLQNQVGEYAPLIARFRDDLREANGQLKYLQPLIVQRRGASDERSRVELARLLGEQTRVQTLKDSAQAKLEEVRGYLDADKQELELLRPPGRRRGARR